jgi:hypothetical protein
MAEPSQWRIKPDGSAESVEPYVEPVAWLTGEAADRLEERAAGEIRDQMKTGTPAGTTLLEIFYGTRRREVKSMAARCSVYVGEFGPFVDALRDSDQRYAWTTHIETLRSAMSLNPASAQSIKEALVRARGPEDAANLFEMLRGYNAEQIGLTPEELPTGAVEKLIGWLENDSLDYRVLAAHNLREITGKNLLPNPAASPTERAKGIRLWRQRLKAGELAPVGLETSS